MGVVGRLRYSDALDLAHAAGRETVMALHRHHHGDGWDVTEDEDKESSKRKEVVALAVVCVDSNRETEEFLGEGPKKGIHVMGLLRARDDAKAKNVLEFKADIRGKVVVVHDERPRSLRAASKRGKAICGKTQGDVTRILEKPVRQLTSVDHDLLRLELLVVARVIDVLHHPWLGLVLLGTMLHLRSHVRVSEEGLESRSDREVDEGFASPAFRVTTGFRTVWASITFGMGPDKATARIDAAVVPLGFKSGKVGDPALDALPRRHIRLWERTSNLPEGLSGHVCVDLESEGSQEFEIFFSKLLFYKEALLEMRGCRIHSNHWQDVPDVPMARKTPSLSSSQIEIAVNSSSDSPVD